LAFFTHVTVGGRLMTAVGVVLGQGQGSNTSALLAAAGEAAEQLIDSASSAARERAAGASGAVSGPRGNAGGHRHPLLPAPGRPSAQPCCRRNHYPQENT
jgi:glucose-6-phosphate isomerase